MIVEDKGNYLIVIPENGMMLYNGETISDGLFTPKQADISQWKEITQEEAEKLKGNEVNSEDPQLALGTADFYNAMYVGTDFGEVIG